LALRCLVELGAETLWSSVEEIIQVWRQSLRDAIVQKRDATTRRLQRVLSDMRPLPPSIAGEFARQLMPLLDEPQTEVQSAAVEAAGSLGMMGLPMLRRALLGVEMSRHSDVPVQAANALGFLGGEGLAVLREALQSEPYSRIRVSIVENLGYVALKLDDDEIRGAVIEDLMVTLRDRSEDRDGHHIVQDASRDWLEPLLQTLSPEAQQGVIDEQVRKLASESPQDRITAVLILSLLVPQLSDETVRRLADLIRDDDLAVQLEAARIYGAIGSRLRRHELERVIKLLGNPDNLQRYLAKDALEVAYPWLDDALIQSIFPLLEHENRKIRAIALRVLELVSARLDAHAIERIQKVTRDTDKDVRYNAVHALGQAGAQMRIEHMQALTSVITDQHARTGAEDAEDVESNDDDDEDDDAGSFEDDLLRSTAIDQLNSVARRLPDELLEALYAALLDPSSMVRRSAVRVLASRGAQLSQEGIERLIEALRDNAEDIREKAVQALAIHAERLNEAQAGTLMERLADSSASVRRAAARAIGSFGNRLSSDQWMNWLATQSGLMRQAAAQALCLMSPQLSDAGLQALRRCLADPYPQARISALRGLARCATELHDGDLEAIIKIVRQKDRTIYEYQAAIEALGAVGPELTEDGKQAVVDFLLQPFYSWREEARVAAMRAMVRVGARLTRNQWTALLADRDAKVLIAAREALFELSGAIQPEDEPVLIAQTQSEDYDIQGAAIYMLASLGERLSLDGVRAILNSLRKDTLLFAELDAVERVGHRLRDQAIAALRAKLGSERYLVGQVIQVLRRLGSQVEISDIPSLSEDLQSHDYTTRLEAIRMFGSTELWPPEVSERVLIPALMDTSWSGRESAAKGLGVLGAAMSDDAIQALIAAIQETVELERASANASQFVCHEALIALRTVADRIMDRQIPVILFALRDEWDLNRCEAAELLALIGPRIGTDGIEALRELAGNRDVLARFTAHQSLAQLHEMVAVEDIHTLIAALQDDDRFIRRGAVEDLGLLGSRLTQEAIQALVDALADEDSLIRVAAAKALGSIGEIRGALGTAALIASLADENQDVREQTVKALGAGDAKTETLTRLEAEAIRVINRQPPEDLYHALLQKQVLEIVGEMGPGYPSSMQMLAEGLDWPFWQVQQQAATSLGQIRQGLPDALIAELLRKWQERAPRSVWRAVDDALAAILAEDTLEE
jgi:HEAT repeat protein